MISVVVWICIATALWHFTVLIPDRFYGGLMGALLAANGGAVVVGAIVLGPATEGNGLIDAIVGLGGALFALVISYAVGHRFDPVTGSRPRN